MAFLNCENRYDCTGVATILSLVIGVVAAFLQITGVITLTPVFSIVAFGVAIIYLAVILLASSIAQRGTACNNCCSPLSVALFGALGTILAAVILLAVTFVATSVIGAIVVGALFFFFSLMISSVACLTKCFVNCHN